MASKKDGKGTKGAKSAKSARNGDADPGGSKGGKSGASTKNMLASGMEKLPKKAYEKELERLQAENGAVFREGAMRAYGEAASGEPARSGEGAARTKPAVHLEPALEDLFFLDPETISKELGIRPKSSQEELDKARRTFAMRYHPDRVPEELRERAALRMQIANMLIDEAKRKRR